jgi:hypothetical protein
MKLHAFRRSVVSASQDTSCIWTACLSYSEPFKTLYIPEDNYIYIYVYIITLLMEYLPVSGPPNSLYDRGHTENADVDPRLKLFNQFIQPCSVFQNLKCRSLVTTAFDACVSILK